MSTFTYNRDIPFADNDPSDDQPLMQTNTNSTDDIIDVDHYSFETSNLDGWHRQCTFPAQNVAAAQVDPASTLYTNADASSASTNSNLWYRNADGIFPTSMVRACGAFTTQASAGAVSLNNGYNVVSITKGATAEYTIKLTAGCVTGDNVIVVTGESNDNNEVTYSFSNPNLVLTLNSNSAGSNISFVVLQI